MAGVIRPTNSVAQYVRYTEIDGVAKKCYASARVALLPRYQMKRVPLHQSVWELVLKAQLRPDRAQPWVHEMRRITPDAETHLPHAFLPSSRSVHCEYDSPLPISVFTCLCQDYKTPPSDSNFLRSDSFFSLIIYRRSEKERK